MWFVKFTVLMLMALFLTSCMAKTMTDYKHAGFLSDYSKLKHARDGSEAEIYTKPGFNLKNYNKILLDRIIIWYRDDAEYKGIDPTELKALADYFHDAIARELGTAYPLVSEPGTDVLRLRIAITELVATRPAVSAVVLVLPYVTIGDIASGATTKGGMGSSPYVGDAAIEAEALDSLTNEQLAAFVERRIGKKYDIDLNQGTVVGTVTQGVTAYAKAYTYWGYAKDAFDYWAKKLRQRLDKAHGIKKAETAEKRDEGESP
jgi:hypothetical protein